MGPSEYNKGSDFTQRWFPTIHPSFQISTSVLCPGGAFEGLHEWLGGILTPPTWPVLIKGILTLAAQGDVFLAFQVRILDAFSHRSTALYTVRFCSLCNMNWKDSLEFPEKLTAMYNITSMGNCFWNPNNWPTVKLGFQTTYELKIIDVINVTYVIIFPDYTTY